MARPPKARLPLKLAALELFVEHLGDVRTILEVAISGESAFEDKVRAACRACYKLYDEQLQVFRFVLLVQHELAKSLPSDLRMPQDVVTDLIKGAVANGDLRREAKGEEAL